MTNHQVGDIVKEIGDGVAVISGVAVFMSWIPAAAGIVTIIYTLWRMIEALDHRKRDQVWPFAPFGSPGRNKDDDE
jgi:hypothetical protein